MLREQTELLDEEETCLLLAGVPASAVVSWHLLTRLPPARLRACLQALPNGHISPALFVALRVLCADEAEAAGWDSFEDALSLPAAAPTSAADAEGSEEGEEGEEEGQSGLGPVQVWPVLDANGQSLATAAAAAAAGGQEQQQGYAALLNASMCRLLQEEAQQRLAAYAGSLQDDLLLLQEQERQQGAAAAAAGAAPAVGAAAAAAGGAAAAAGEASRAEGEQSVAERAALVLRITEKEVLHNLLIALDCRLASLPQPAAAEEQAAAGAAAGKAATRGRQKKGSISAGQKRKQR